MKNFAGIILLTFLFCINLYATDSVSHTQEQELQNYVHNLPSSELEKEIMRVNLERAQNPSSYLDKKFQLLHDELFKRFGAGNTNLQPIE